MFQSDLFGKQKTNEFDLLLLTGPNVSDFIEKDIMY